MSEPMPQNRSSAHNPNSMPANNQQKDVFFSGDPVFDNIAPQWIGRRLIGMEAAGRLRAWLEGHGYGCEGRIYRHEVDAIFLYYWHMDGGVARETSIKIGYGKDERTTLKNRCVWSKGQQPNATHIVNLMAAAIYAEVEAEYAPRTCDTQENIQRKAEAVL